MEMVIAPPQIGFADRSPIVTMEDVTFGFGPNGHKLITDLSLSLYAGEIASIVGASGVGKTTILRLLAGDFQPKRGRVTRNTEIALVAQNYTLFPHLSIRKNVELVLRRHEPISSRFFNYTKIDNKVYDLLGEVGLTNESDRLPSQLSGGQRQRVAIAQALAMNAGVLLMDEPFGALDISTRQQLQDLLLDLAKSQNLVVVLVTHDLEEALYCSDRILLVNDNSDTITELDNFRILTNKTERIPQLKTSNAFLKHLALLHKAVAAQNNSNPEGSDHILDLGIVTEDNLVELEAAAETIMIITKDLFQEQNNKTIADAVKINWSSGKPYSYVLPSTAIAALEYLENAKKSHENITIHKLNSPHHWLFSLGETAIYKLSNNGYRGYSYLGNVGATSLFRIPDQLVTLINREMTM